ncbi:MAG: hypothetical protein LBH21_03435 [Gracilibacteraceae bacterium]|jgi:hypothetical protein|nr:hypothetical protein [Gracilibacteraceae bacterium]
MRNLKTAIIILLPCALLIFVFGAFFLLSPAPPRLPLSLLSEPAAVPAPDPVPSPAPLSPPAAPAPNQTAAALPEGGALASSSSSVSSSSLAAAPSRYIYEQLSPAQKTVYDRFRAALWNMDAEAEVSRAEERGLGSLEIIDIFYAVICDYPEIFWSDSYIYTSRNLRFGETYLNVRFSYTMSAAERAETQRKIDAWTEACLSGLDAGADDFRKILYVYEYIINNTEYDLAADYNQDIVSVFLYGRSVCMGYTKATQYLLQRLGVACTAVSGAAAGLGPHAWNLVRAEGEYYYLDTTWGDPDLARNAYVSHDYFLVTSADLAVTHQPDVKYALPDCVSTRLNYFNVMNRRFDRYDKATVLRAMREDLALSDLTAVRFSSVAAYREAVSDLFDNQGIFDISSHSLISYFLSDELCIITVQER